MLATLLIALVPACGGPATLDQPNDPPSPWPMSEAALAQGIDISVLAPTPTDEPAEAPAEPEAPEPDEAEGSPPPETTADPPTEVTTPPTDSP